MIKFSTAMARAEKHCACKTDMEVIHSLSCWDDFFAHERSLFWIYWYARNVIQGRWRDAEPYMLRHVRGAWLGLWLLKEYMKEFYVHKKEMSHD